MQRQRGEQTPRPPSTATRLAWPGSALSLPGRVLALLQVDGAGWACASPHGCKARQHQSPRTAVGGQDEHCICSATFMACPRDTPSNSYSSIHSSIRFRSSLENARPTVRALEPLQSSEIVACLSPTFPSLRHSRRETVQVPQRSFGEYCTSWSLTTQRRGHRLVMAYSTPRDGLRQGSV